MKWGSQSLGLRSVHNFRRPSERDLRWVSGSFVGGDFLADAFCPTLLESGVQTPIVE
jgi:hypothetical protein